MNNIEQNVNSDQNQMKVQTLTVSTKPSGSTAASVGTSGSTTASAHSSGTPAASAPVAPSQTKWGSNGSW